MGVAVAKYRCGRGDGDGDRGHEGGHVRGLGYCCEYGYGHGHSCVHARGLSVAVSVAWPLP